MLAVQFGDLGFLTLLSKPQRAEFCLSFCSFCWLQGKLKKLRTCGNPSHLCPCVCQQIRYFCLKFGGWLGRSPGRMAGAAELLAGERGKDPQGSWAFPQLPADSKFCGLV